MEPYKFREITESDITIRTKWILKSKLKLVYYESSELRGVIIDKEDFIRIYFKERLTQGQISEKFEVVSKCVKRSYWVYKRLFPDKFRETKRANYSRGLVGNTHGKKEEPSKVLGRIELEKYIERGYPLSKIATLMGVSEFLVRSNCKHYSLRMPKRGLTPLLYACDQEIIDRLFYINPELRDSYDLYAKNPEKFFNELYETFLKVMDLVFYIKEFSGKYGWLVETGKLKKGYINWSLNRLEAKVSSALLDRGIRNFIRQFRFDPGKHYVSDFYFPSINLILELQGAQHYTDKKTMERDRKRLEKMKELGYRYLDFSYKEVENNLKGVIDKIEQELRKDS